MANLLPEERRLIARLRTPLAVQRWLDSLPYNKGNVGKTLRSFRGVLAHKTAHCMEGALAAAFILQHHGYPPLLLDLSSSDGLDHVCFLFEARRPGPGLRAGWGTVSTSRYPGLRGRKPVFRSVRDLAWSYCEPFVDATGAVRGYATFDLRALQGTAAGRGRRGFGRERPADDEALASMMEWALDRKHVWRIERALFRNKHARLRLAPSRERELRRQYLAWKASHPEEEPPRAFYPRPASYL